MNKLLARCAEVLLVVIFLFLVVFPICWGITLALTACL